MIYAWPLPPVSESPGSPSSLTYRGGIAAEVDGQADLADEFGIPPQTSITETRKYAYHRKIERNRTAAHHAKKFHGTRCQACDLDFGERYGKIGQGFIEAHHLRPIATLEEGIPVKYDVAVDFAALCSNCHRMINRFSEPSDLVAFRKFISVKNVATHYTQATVADPRSGEDFE